MQKEILISVDDYETRVALLENLTLVELFIEREGKRRLVGNIYKARVEHLLPGMQAAFVDLGLDRNGFLYVTDVASEVEEYQEMLEGEEEVAEELEEEKLRERMPTPASIEDVLKKGQEILVQIAKEPIGTKGSRVTSNITLPGRYLVLMPTADHVGISRRIEDDKERERLRDIVRNIKPRGMGIIVRTAAEGKSEEECQGDIEFLTKLWENIKRQAEKVTAPAFIHEDLSLVLRTIRDLFTEDVDRLIIDSALEYQKIAEFLDTFHPSLKGRVELYKGKESLFSFYHLEEEIEKALRRKVWLKCGGYIVIDQLEALVVIDVNTGRYVGRKNLEETVLVANLEAAAEIARQLRLRDIGGIIIIDFIDMEREENRNKVLRALEEWLKKDRTRCKILELTSLGLVEMTRKRVRQSLSRMLCQPCPYCGGRGTVLSEETVSIRAQRLIRQVCQTSEEKELLVKVHPDVAQHLLKEDGDRITRLEEALERVIVIEGDKNLHLEEVKIFSARTNREIGPR